MTDVFIVYDRDDLERVRPLVNALRKSGLSIWWDQDLPGGAKWLAHTHEVLAGSRCAVVVWSTKSAVPTAGFILEEATEAWKLGIQLPVRIDPVVPPFGFSGWQSFDLVDWRSSDRHPGFKKLRQAIKEMLDSTPPSSLAPPSPIQPPPTPPQTLGRQFRAWLPAAGLAAATLIIGLLIGIKFGPSGPTPTVPVGPTPVASANSPPPTASGAIPITPTTSTKPVEPSPPAVVEASGAISTTPTKPVGPSPTAAVESCAQQLKTAAAPGPVEPAPPPLQGPMAIAGGPVSLTYFHMAKDLVELAKPLGLSLQPMVTKGTLDNITRLAGRENAGVGFAQSDIEIYLEHAGNAILKSSVGKLRLIASLHNEEVHVLTRPNIKSLDDLKGKRIVVANDSQGSLVTATNLFRLTKIEPGKIDDGLDPYEAVCSVIQGTADAMFITTGRPAPLLTAIAKLSPPHSGQVRLMQIADKPHSVYEKATIPKGSYSWQTEDVQTVSVQALLIAYDFSSRGGDYHDKRCVEVAALGRILRDNIQTLQNGKDFHDKWKQVNPRHMVIGWKQDSCSAPSGLPTPPNAPKPAARAASK